jgi:hypothetical protein
VNRLLEGALWLRARSWKVRAAILAGGGLACLGLLLAPSGSAPTSAGAPAAASVAGQQSSSPPSPTVDVTTTSIDPKAIQAGVAALLSHDGPTPQELAAPPAVSRGGGHAKKAGGHAHK